MIDDCTVHLKNISKKYDSWLFKNLNYKVKINEPLAIIGPNGSGKSTLIKILLGWVDPDKGEVLFYYKNDILKVYKYTKYIALVSPYINPYLQLTPAEIMKFTKVDDKQYADYLMEEFGLYKYYDKHLKVFSTGMLQRFKLIIALLKKPLVLLLDEPTSNLDIKGKDITYKILNELKNTVIVIATNDKDDINFCSGSLNVAEFS